MYVDNSTSVTVSVDTLESIVVFHCLCGDVGETSVLDFTDLTPEVKR